MIDQTGIGVADVARSAVFYDMALEALGFTPRYADAGERGDGWHRLRGQLSHLLD
jgi:hypothetical protein